MYFIAPLFISSEIILWKCSLLSHVAPSFIILSLRLQIRYSFSLNITFMMFLYHFFFLNFCINSQRSSIHLDHFSHCLFLFDLVQSISKLPNYTYWSQNVQSPQLKMLGVVVWNVKGEKGNLHGEGKTNILWTNICWAMQSHWDPDRNFDKQTLLGSFNLHRFLLSSAGEVKRHRFDPWVKKIPCKRARQLTPVFLLGEPHGQRSLEV